MNALICKEHCWQGIDTGRMCVNCGVVEKQVSNATLPEQTVEPAPRLRFEMSPGIGTLVGALAKARKQFSPIIKTEVNPFFKSRYADLAAVIEATKDGLSDNGLAVLQLPAFTRESGLVEIKTILAHSSGEWIASSLEMPVTKTDSQAVGSGISYGRRYSYSAILNVASETDDDANAAVSGEFKKPKKEEKLPYLDETPEQFDQRTLDQQNITPAQIQAIDAALKSTGKSEAEIIAALGFIGEKRIEHIKKNQFDKFLKWASGVKKAQVKPASQIAPPKDDSRTKAMRRLWATAAELSIPEGDVKTYAYTKHHVESMSVLTEPQLQDCIDWLKAVDVAARES